MKRQEQTILKPVAVLVVAVLLILGHKGPALAVDVCGEGLGVPPFLAQGEDPNVLLIIDNSASMYDLAYVPAAAAEQGSCYDGTFDGSKTYAGYFEHDYIKPDYIPRWYSYDLSDGPDADTDPDDPKFVQVADETAMGTACDAAPGTKYSGNKVCIKIDSTAPPGSQVKFFGANSNFLNWAAASKFDAEKKVLTGGKWANDPNSPGGYLLVMESRGCMGKTFIRQVTLKNTAGTDYKLVLGVRSETNDTLPASNYLTRIDIHQLNTTGFVSAACQDAIDEFTSPSASLGTIKDKTKDCMEATGTTLSASHTAFNHILQECWYFNSHGVFQPGAGTVVTMKNDCVDVYGTPSGTQPPPGYLGPSALKDTDICYGVYQPAAGVDPGYVGQCWKYTTGGGTTTTDDCTPGVDTPTGTEAAPGGSPFCDNTIAKWKKCDGTYNKGQDECRADKNPATSGDWIVTQVTKTAPGDTVGWIDPGADTCVDSAIKEYCGALNDPAEPDPSDAMSSEGTTYNVPAYLMQFALDAQVGDPLLTMKGLVAQDSVPTGILDEYSNDIRFGTMAFNYGTRSECAPIQNYAGGPYVANLPGCLVDVSPITATTAANASKTDGARVVTYIGKNSDHFTALKNGINDLRAEAWTPTAEAYMSAIGYYTQRADLRINSTAPNQDFLVNSADYASYPSWAANTLYSGTPTVPVVVRDSNNKLYQTFSTGTSSPLQADGVTASTGPKDDGSATLTWTPIDPVVNYCQSNNVLILTDGASTADQRATSTGNLVAIATANSDGDNAESGGYACGALKGSTLLDDISYYGFHGAIYPAANFTDEETGLPVTGQNISSYIISTGTPRAVQEAGLPAECDSQTLLENTAENAGSALYVADNPATLEEKIRKILIQIKAGLASGSASSVISASRGGEGAIYQAIFWPRMVDETETITWIGDVHALLIDTYGNMYEDDGDVDGGILGTIQKPRQLTQTAPGAATYTNSRVVFYYDSASKQTLACNGDLNAAGNDCPAPGIKKGLNQVKYLWSTAEWLSTIAPHPDYKPAPASKNLAIVGADASEDIKVNRATYLSKDRQRYVYTWIDLNNDGVVDQATEWLPFEAAQNLGAKATAAPRGPVTLDFNAQTAAEVNNIVNWIRGFDTIGDDTIRSRQRKFSFDPAWDPAVTPNPPDLTWRLADVIHSTPIAVTRPSENLHLLYKDASYAAFAQAYNQRRHVIYYGSNGGMLHAVNGGFYDDQNKKFCRTASCNDEGDWPNIVSPELGAEMWAYVPYNLLPHLKCLMDPEYEHKYYVDLRPRVFDVKLWDSADATHIQGWGTILVVGMRFGGSPVDANDLDLDGNGSADAPGDPRRFSSSYIIMDVTDPEQPPRLLGELTHTSADPPVYASMAYTTSIPTVVPMKEGNVYNWYLVMGSGPTELDGTSDQRAKLAVYNLKRLTAATPAAFRVEDDPPDATNQTGLWELSDNDSFISDLITVDFETKEDYKADVVYFGTVSDDWGDWGGKMYRLVTRKIDTGTCKQESTTPSQWTGLLGAGNNPNVLIDVDQPVTAAASVGTDYFNYWVYFGTGRFFDRNDKSDNSSNATQYYYGVKEPRDWGGVGCADIFTWREVEKTAGVGPAGEQGSLGLKDVTRIRALNNSPASSATLYCETADPLDHTDKTCLPNGVDTFDQLVPTIAGSGSAANLGTDGWYRGLTIARERNLGQATLLGGLLTYTTYQPYLNLCLPEGLGYLYGLYYQTGTPWHKAVFGRQAVDTSVEYRINMGRGLATTPNLHVGAEAGTKAFVQTSTGAIIEIEQPNLPLDNTKTGRRSWRQIKPAN